MVRRSYRFALVFGALLFIPHDSALAFRKPDEPLPGEAADESAEPPQARPRDAGAGAGVDSAAPRLLRASKERSAPDAHKYRAYPNTTLTGAFQTDAAAITAARSYLAQRPELTGGVPIAQFQARPVGRVPAQGTSPAMVYLQFTQLHEGLEVEGSRIQLSIKLLPGRTVLMSVQSTVYPGLVLPAARAAGGGAAADTQGRAARALQLDPAKRKLRRERRTIRFVDGRWRRVHTVRYEGSDQAAVVDEDSEEAWTEDDRLYAALSGSVRGRGVRFDPEATGTSLDTLNLKDAEVHIINSPVTAYTNASGLFSFPTITTSQLLSAALRGRWAAVTNVSGADLLVFGAALPGVPLSMTLNPAGADEFSTAQVNGYYHTTAIHDWVQSRLPSLTAVNTALPVNVNVPYTCNAFYDLSFGDINFFSAGPSASEPGVTCSNTAFDTVVYHEYGHFVDDMAGGITDYGLSEGWGDVLASFSSGQPIIGKGFLGPGSIVRTADNAYQFPSDGRDEEHALGQAWAGFAWHLRARLMQRYGLVLGAYAAEQLVVPTLLANAETFQAAVDEVVALDDDDANIANGTPHLAEIAAAAADHGLPIRSVARLTNPINDAEILTSAGTVSVMGEIRLGASRFSTYALSYGLGNRPTAWTPIGAPVSTLVAAGELGRWAVGGLPDNLYTLRLEVTATDGSRFTDKLLVALASSPRHMITSSGQDGLPSLTAVQPDVYHDGVINRMVWKDWSDYTNAVNRPGIYYCDYNPATGACPHQQILDDPDYNSYFIPRVSGDLIVWEYRKDIYLFDVAQARTVQLTNDAAIQQRPSVSGDWIVWEDWRNGTQAAPNADIYACQFIRATQTCAAAQRLTVDPTGQFSPDIGGQTVVWLDGRDGRSEIYRYDLVQRVETRVTTTPAETGGSKASPRTDGHHVIWLDSRDRFSNDVYLHDLRTGAEQRISGPESSGAGSLRVSGSRIVWTDGGCDGKDSSVHLYDLATGAFFQLTGNDAPQCSARISGNTIVWLDERNGHFSTSLFATSLPGNLPPTLTFSQLPANGAAVSGAVPISGVAADDTALKQLEVLVDARSALSVFSGGGPISFAHTWDTTREANGAHVLRIRATDQADNVTEVTRSVLVANNCHILTAAFGRPDAAPIQALWALHHRLLPGKAWDAPWHQAYLRWYDRQGPNAAAIVRRHPLLRALVRLATRPAAAWARSNTRVE